MVANLALEGNYQRGGTKKRLGKSRSSPFEVIRGKGKRVIVAVGSRKENCWGGAQFRQAKSEPPPGKVTSINFSSKIRLLGRFPTCKKEKPPNNSRVERLDQLIQLKKKLIQGVGNTAGESFPNSDEEEKFSCMRGGGKLSRESR